MLVVWAHVAINQLPEYYNHLCNDILQALHHAPRQPQPHTELILKQVITHRLIWGLANKISKLLYQQGSVTGTDSHYVFQPVHNSIYYRLTIPHPTPPHTHTYTHTHLLYTVQCGTLFAHPVDCCIMGILARVCIPHTSLTNHTYVVCMPFLCNSIQHVSYGNTR